MIRLAAVALIVAAMLVDSAGRAGRRRTTPRGTALALGFTLIVALVAGEFLRRFRLPRLTGYLLFGLLVGPYLGNVITEGDGAGSFSSSPASRRRSSRSSPG